MINLSIHCEGCDSHYALEFYKEEVMETNGKPKPQFCPFCGEEIEDDIEDVEDDEDEQDDE